MELSGRCSSAATSATGMTVAHQVGIVHRDLKPANVLINQEGLLKIVDFGVAAAHREGDTQLTKTGYVIGSPKYMAPEQILGKKVDERADIYAEGVMLYEMVTGVPPYARGDHMSVMYQHVQGGPGRPRRSTPPCPRGSRDAGHEDHGRGQDQALPDHGRAAAARWNPIMASARLRVATLRHLRPPPGLLACVTSNFLAQAIDYVATELAKRAGLDRSLREG